LPESLLEHLELTSADFATAISLDQARTSWKAFQRPDDTVAVYNHGTARLLLQMGSRSSSCLVLKSVDLHPGRRYRSLDELVTEEGLAVAPAQHRGRAGRRLAKVTAFVRHLNALERASANREEFLPALSKYTDLRNTFSGLERVRAVK